MTLWLINHVLPKKCAERLGGSLAIFDGLESLRSPKETLMVFLTSVVIWMFELCKYWLLCMHFHFR